MSGRVAVVVLVLAACDARSSAPARPSVLRKGIAGAVRKAIANAQPDAGAEEGGVTVALEHVLVGLTRGGGAFSCHLVLTNDTGAPLRVLSNFSSAFDGLTLVVLAGGREVVRQAYVYHQSPYALEDEAVELAVGRNARTLVFPVADPPSPDGGGLEGLSGQIFVHVEGGLKGTRFASGLHSNVYVMSL